MDLRDRLKKLDPEFKPTTIKATSAQRSNEIVKSVSKSEFSILNTRMRPIIEENLREQYPDQLRGSGISSEKGDER